MGKYRILGIMSGTSLDGVDMCLCEFDSSLASQEFKINKAITLPYPKNLESQLRNQNISGRDLSILDKDVATFFAECINSEFANYDIDFISSHGHTIFHDPSNDYTLQIGHGGILAKKTGIAVVSDFRTEDVALGGQGAPLVPIGDKNLFAQYEACVNLGGFANISYSNTNNERIAYDICAVNFVLNKLASELGKPYDKDGKISASVEPNPDLLSKLTSLDYYKLNPPKSLGAEWVESYVLPILEESDLSFQAIMATFTHHCAEVIVANLPQGEVLFSGGGTKNKFLMGLIESKTKSKIIIPDEQLLDFKEAVVFAYLGLLRWEGRINVLSSVTGASKNSCSGSVYLP